MSKQRFTRTKYKGNVIILGEIGIGKSTFTSAVNYLFAKRVPGVEFVPYEDLNYGKRTVIHGMQSQIHL